jgi:hypothetical protein
MLQTFLTVAGQVHGEPLGPQPARHELGELAVILDNQYSHGESISRSLTPRHAVAAIAHGTH